MVNRSKTLPVPLWRNGRGLYLGMRFTDCDAMRGFCSSARASNRTAQNKHRESYMADKPMTIDKAPALAIDWC